MTKTKGADALLTVSAIGLRIYMVFTALFIVGIAAFVGVILVAPPADFAAQLASGPPATLPVILLSAAIAIVILVLSILFAVQLGRVIGTVKSGDPFEPANADRLTRMGWYALGATVAGWVIGATGHFLEREFDGLEVSVSPVGGLVLVITLFVLARVFRHGAELRDDLMGTV